MAVGDWIANLFQSEQTRGLSGGAAGGVALDDANPYYNYRLRRHLADGELSEEPRLLWYTSSHPKRRTGLGIHIASEKGDGVAGFTDVLVVLSKEDYAESIENDAQGEWLQKATLALSAEFDEYCKREGFKRRYEHRQLGFKFLCDGSEEMEGQSLGLARGEFVTGLLANLYTGAVRGSKPVIGVHVNLPGAWEGYREVGRLYSDQILFTLGSHWLDNFRHPSLREAALYRLQQHPDGSFVHIVNPDLQDRYQVTSADQGGASVLTLATRDGDPLAYMVLAVVDEAEAAAEAARPNIQMPAMPTARPGGYTIPPPMLLEEEEAQNNIAPSAPPPPRQAAGKVGGQKTIIPDAVEERIFTLQERGALLQKVHFGAFMEGYDVYVGQRGEMGTSVDDPAGIFQVRRRYVSFVSNVAEALVDGKPAEPGAEITINGDVVIEVAGQRLEYRDLRGVQAEGWPYVGEIRRPASSTYMMFGDGYQIGRSRECRVVLPDEPRNDNIQWKDKVVDGTMIRARTGDIPMSRFYTDSIMVASEHGEIDLKTDGPIVRCLARHCYVYVRRTDRVFELFPTTSERQPLEMSLEPGDEVLIGNCLFKVGFTPIEEAVAPAPAPEVQLTADRLVDVVGSPDLTSLEQRTDVRDEPPAPAGIGGKGTAPPPVPVQAAGPDSILGEGVKDDQQSIKERLSQSLKSKIAQRSQEPPPDRVAAAPTGPSEDEVVDVYEAEVVEEPDEEPPTELGTPGRFEDGDFDLPDFGEGEAKKESWDALDTGAPNDVFEADSEPTAPNEVLTEEPPVQAEPPPPPKAEPPPPPEAEPPPPPTPPSVAAAPPPVAAPSATPTPAAAASAPPPAPSGGIQVIYVDDGQAQFELSRRMQILQIGWMVRGDVTCGNHSGCDLVVPENRLAEDQTFAPVEYFKLTIKGRRARLELVKASEVLVNEKDAKETVYEKPEDLVLDVIRRDDMGEEDFGVRMQLGEDATLPDPRARLLEMDVEDPLAAALFTKGLPAGQPRHVDLQGFSLTLTHDGKELVIGDYLGSYKQADGGWAPFFIQHGQARYETAPEDGSPIRLKAGDRFLLRSAIYEVVAK